MTRIEETTLEVNKFFKENRYQFLLEPSENCLNYSIDLGIFPLCFQIEFYDKEQELLYSKEYCILQSWIPIGEYGDNKISIYTECIDSLDTLINYEIESIISKYKDYLRLINKVEKSISNIRELFDELNLEFSNDITFSSFLN